MAKLTKTQALAIHAKRRLLERYGMSINRHQYRDLCLQVMRSHSFKTISNTRSVRMATLPDGRKVPVVYDKSRQRIVTFLPEDARELDN